MRKSAIAPIVLTLVGLASSVALAETAPTPLCGDEVKKPTDDDTAKPPKASTDPLCGDVKKPTDDGSENPPKASAEPLCGDGTKKPDGDEQPPKT
jgi:hypothetical protein